MFAAKSSSDLQPIIDRLSESQSALAELYHRALRDTLFANRPQVQPYMLKGAAINEAAIVLAFFQSPNPLLAREHGAKLCQIGYGEQALVRLLHTTRQFLMRQIDLNLLVTALEVADVYQNAVLLGFIQAQEKIILSEQERLRIALQRTLNNYIVRLEVAANIATATTSILDMHSLLQTAVTMVRERLGLYYVGVFLVEPPNPWAVLQAGAADTPRVNLLPGHQVALDDSSLVGRCLLQGEAQILLNLNPHHSDVLLLPETRAVAALPLLVHNTIIGALLAQSRTGTAFFDHEVTIMRLLADQLANAITTARLVAELRRSEEKYRTVLENIDEGYYEMDLAGRFTFVSDVVSLILGYDREQLPQLSYRQFVDLSHLDGMARIFEHVLATGETVKSFEGKIVRPDGSARFVEFSVSLIRSTTGTPISFQGVVRDITEKVDLLEDLRHAKIAAERASQAKSLFLASMSHELRTPLTVILGYTEVLAESLSAGDKQLLQQLDKIQSSARHLLSLISDILDFSKIEAGKMDVSPSEFTVMELVDEVAATVRPLVNKNKNVFRVRLAENLGTIYSDQVKVRQILLNLISNAAKFTELGTILLSVERQAPVLLPGSNAETPTPPEQIIFTVTDTGIGMSDHQKRALFEAFRQAEASTTHKYGGTGLGLAISRRLCQLLGGDITVTSDIGRGSTFTVSLPVRYTPSEANLLSQMQIEALLKNED